MTAYKNTTTNSERSYKYSEYNTIGSSYYINSNSITSYAIVVINFSSIPNNLKANSFSFIFHLFFNSGIIYLFASYIKRNFLIYLINSLANNCRNILGPVRIYNVCINDSLILIIISEMVSAFN